MALLKRKVTMDGRTEMFSSFVIKILFFFVKREMSTFVGLGGGRSLLNFES